MTQMETKQEEGLTIVQLRGSLTVEGVAKVENDFAAATHRPQGRVVVDLTGVEMVTTPALSMFIDAANFLKSNGGKVVFTETTEPVRDVLRRLRLTLILRTVEGMEKAKAEARA